MDGAAESAAAETASPRTQHPWPWYTAAVLFFIVDRWAKSAALGGLTFGRRGTAEFVLFLNHGIAFSIPVPSGAFWAAAGAALVLLLWSLGRALTQRSWTTGILVLVLFGAISNLIDRALYGATVDYLLFFSRSAVNIADGMILVGVVTLFARQMRRQD